MRTRRACCWSAAFASLWLPTMVRAADARPSLGLHLQVETKPKSVSPTRASSSAAMLVLNAMTESRRELLGRSLGKLLAAVDRKKNPFFVSLDDGEERRTVEDLIAQTAPAFTAAATLAAGRWPSPEGDVLVRPVVRCASGRQCVRIGTSPGKEEGERRARFLAWPLGYAVVLALETRVDVAVVVEALRAPGSFQIGLVLTSEELHSLRASRALSALKLNARRLVKLMPGARTGLLATLSNIAKAGTGKDALAWLKLPPNTILVVPRLSALATPEQFVADVRERLSATAARVDWLASPR